MKRMADLCRKFAAMNSLPRSGTFAIRTAIALLFCGILGSAGVLEAQNLTANIYCSGIDTINLGSVLKFDTVKRHLNLINKFSNGATSWHISGGSSIFTLSDSTGNAQLDSTWITYINFNPGSTLGLIAGTITLTADSNCSATLVFEATVVGPTKKDSTLSLQDSNNIIAFETNQFSDTAQIYLKNTSDSALLIDSLEVTQSNAFSIASRPPFPITLSKQDSFAIEFTYSRNSPGSDNGLLQFTTRPDKPILPAITMQGVRTRNNDVQTQPNTTALISLYPNPSHNALTMHAEGMSNVRVTITDLLGREILRASVPNNWSWDWHEQPNVVPAGTYFALVTGIDASGHAVHVVERIVLK